LASPVCAVAEQGNRFATVVAIPTVPLLEQEPNNTQEAANPTEASVEAFAGQIQSPGDVDWFQLTVDSKQHLCVTAHTRDVGSPADIVLEIRDSNGKMLQESDDAGANDAQLSLSLPDAGTFFISIRELTGQGGPTFTYDLDIQRGGCVELTTNVDQIGVPRNGTVTVPVTVQRHGFAEAFEIVASGLPEGIVATPIVVSPTQKTAYVALHSTSNSSFADSPYQRFEIHGRTSADARPATAMYVPTPPGQKSASSPALMRLQTGVFAYGVETAPFSLNLESPNIVVTPGASAKITIHAQRTADWTEPIELASTVPAAELPGGITIEAAKIAENSGEINIKAGDAAKPGRYSLSLHGTLNKDKITIIQPVPTITLEVTEAEAAKKIVSFAVPPES
jgi:hypothetical protein